MQRASLMLGVGLLALSGIAFAQAPDGNYDTADTSSPSALRFSLHEIIDDHTRFPYTSSATDTWDVLEIADEDQDNPNNVITIYKNASYPKEGGGNSNYNREHSWPVSYGIPDDVASNIPYTDMHHLFIAVSIEARVPFLDHRLVEFLASVPLVYHEQLFWDKRIVREQLAGLLPSYPADFLKVPFVYVPGNKSVQALEAAVLRRTYHPFMEKYVQPGDPLLPRDGLEMLYRVATSGADGARRAEMNLMRVMQKAIFMNNCVEGFEPPSIPASSPLQEAAPPA